MGCSDPGMTGLRGRRATALSRMGSGRAGGVHAGTPVRDGLRRLRQAARGGACLGLGRTLMTNGSAIVVFPPPCPCAAPLSDVAHLGSIVLCIASSAAALWTLWLRRAQGASPRGPSADVAGQRPGARGGHDPGAGQWDRRAVRAARPRGWASPAAQPMADSPKLHTCLHRELHHLDDSHGVLAPG
jgi:hypothetical protein